MSEFGFGQVELTEGQEEFLILGWLRWAISTDEFPLNLAGVRENYDDEGSLRSFTVLTKSDRQYSVFVTYDAEIEVEELEPDRG